MGQMAKQQVYNALSELEYYLYSSSYKSEINKEIARRISDNWSISNAPFQMNSGSSSLAYAILFERRKTKIKKGF